jgi:hypothetical protein
MAMFNYLERWDSKNLRIEDYLKNQLEKWNKKGCTPLLDLQQTYQVDYHSFIPLAYSLRVSEHAEDLDGAPERKFVRIRQDTLEGTTDKEPFKCFTEKAERVANAWVEPGSSKMKCFDAGFIFAPPGAPASRWHLESWEDYVMVYTLIESTNNTGSVETFQAIYENVAKLPWEPPEAVGEAMRALETPKKWGVGKSRRRGLQSSSTYAPGTSVMVYANAIHRYPAVALGNPPNQNPEHLSWIVMYHAIGDPSMALDANSPVFEEQWISEYVQGVATESSEGDEEQKNSDIDILG